MAIVTGRRGARRARAPIELGAPLPALAAATTATLFVQLILGALTRHSGAGLAIPDFPLAFGRLVPPFETNLIAIHSRIGSARSRLGHGLTLATTALRHRSARPVRRLRFPRRRVVRLQISLGASIIWTHRSVVPTTTHS